MKKSLKQIIPVFVIIGAVSLITPLVIQHSSPEQLSYLESSYFAILIAITIYIVSKEEQKTIVDDISEIKKHVIKIEEKLCNESKTEKSSSPITPEEMSNFLKEWEIVIKTQMHFNDMIMKVRTATVSFVVGVFSAAAYILQYDLPLKIFGHSVHASVMVIMTGIVMLTVMFLIDYFYYFKMLLGSVNVGYEFEKEFQSIQSTHKYFTLSSSIRNAIGKPHRSKYFVMLFYSSIIVAGFAFLVVVITGFNAEI